MNPIQSESPPSFLLPAEPPKEERQKVLKSKKHREKMAALADAREGLQFHHWTLLVKMPKSPDSWVCRCRCGTLRIMRMKLMTNSCGCKGSNEDHADYTIWLGMRTRCLRPAAHDFPRYGGRGISICSRWLESFEQFIEDMGPRPEPRAEYSIDRIDNDGNYTPDNCRWASIRTQSRNKGTNRKLTFRGKTQCLTAWAEETGINICALHQRLKRGWSVEIALALPVAGGRLRDRIRNLTPTPTES